jgi:hypothetical protein
MRNEWKGSATIWGSRKETSKIWCYGKVIYFLLCRKKRKRKKNDEMIEK